MILTCFRPMTLTCFRPIIPVPPSHAPPRTHPPTCTPARLHTRSLASSPLLPPRTSFDEQARLAAEGDEEAVGVDSDFVRALEFGLPPTAGMFVLACAQAHTHTHMYAGMQACMHAGIHTYIHTHTHTYIHTYIHTYMNTYMHACMHAYMCLCMCVLLGMTRCKHVSGWGLGVDRLCMTLLDLPSIREVLLFPILRDKS